MDEPEEGGIRGGRRFGFRATLCVSAGLFRRSEGQADVSAGRFTFHAGSVGTPRKRLAISSKRSTSSVTNGWMTPARRRVLASSFVPPKPSLKNRAQLSAESTRATSLPTTPDRKSVV